MAKLLAFQINQANFHHLEPALAPATAGMSNGNPAITSVDSRIWGLLMASGKASIINSLISQKMIQVLAS